MREDSGHRQHSGMGPYRRQGGLFHLGSTRARSSKPDRYRSTKIPLFQVKAVVEEEPNFLNLRAAFTPPVLLPWCLRCLQQPARAIPVRLQEPRQPSDGNTTEFHTQLGKGKMQATCGELHTSVSCTLPSFFLCECF